MAARILAESPAGHPRGQFPAEEQAQQFRDNGIPVTVVMHQPTDRFLVITDEEVQR